MTIIPFDEVRLSVPGRRGAETVARDRPVTAGSSARAILTTPRGRGLALLAAGLLAVIALALYSGVLAGPAPPGLTFVPAIFGATVAA